MISLNQSSGEIIWDGAVIGLLSPSEMQVLQCLLDDPGELVTREMLLAAGWPGKVVQLNSLTVAIKNIRKGLANISDEQIIETRHRKGYVLHYGPLQAFAGDNITIEQGDDVVEMADSKVEPSAPVTTLPPSSDNKRKWFFNLCFYLLMAVMVLWSLFITSLDSPLICYEINRAKYCGYSELDQDDIKSLQERTGEAEGTYLYGFNKYIRPLQIHKMD